MLIVTTPIIEGYRIVEYKGLITSKNVRAVNVIRDFLQPSETFSAGAQSPMKR